MCGCAGGKTGGVQGGVSTAPNINISLYIRYSHYMYSFNNKVTVGGQFSAQFTPKDGVNMMN